MRTAFIQQFITEARRNPRLFLMVGDLGYSVVEPYAQEFPDRFVNAGVAEQNMTGMAAGLASEGFHVFTYSIANFPTFRCAEQVRNDVCYHRLSVTIVAVGGGLAYGNLGYSHHGVQDIGMLRTLPNLTVISPADPGETREAVQWLAANPGPSYLRIGKAGEPDLHDVRGIDHGPLLVRPGRGSTAIVASGGVLSVAIAAHDKLAREGRELPVYSMPILKPVSHHLSLALGRYQRIISVHEHVIEGGLSSILREQLPSNIRVDSVHVPESSAGEVGSQTYLRRIAGITPEHIAALVMDDDHA